MHLEQLLEFVEYESDRLRLLLGTRWPTLLGQLRSIADDLECNAGCSESVMIHAVRLEAALRQDEGASALIAEWALPACSSASGTRKVGRSVDVLGDAEEVCRICNRVRRLTERECRRTVSASTEKTPRKDT